MAGRNRINFLLLTILIGIGIFCFSSKVFSETVNVGMTVPNTVICGNGTVDSGEICDGSNLSGKSCKNFGYDCGQLSCSADCSGYVTSSCSNDCTHTCSDSDGPTIAIISTDISQTSAKIFFSASDPGGISSQSFVYGTSTLGLGGTIVSLGSNNYEVDLSGLKAGTVYNYQINSTDNSCGKNSSSKSGNFTTVSPLDSVPPVISDWTIIPGVTTSSITWKTNEDANSEVRYGFTTAYGSVYHSDVFELNHSVLLGSATQCLLPNTTYHTQIISTDKSGNSTASEDKTFVTLKDGFPPPAVSNFLVTKNSSSFMVSWTNPTISSCPDDFVGVKILKKINTYSNSPTDGVIVNPSTYGGTGTNFTDADINLDTTYYYTAFAYDTSGNYSSGVFGSGVINKITTTTVSVCGNGITETGEDCDGGTTNGACPALCSSVCKINSCLVITNCGNGITETGEECDAGSNNGICPSTCSSACKTNNCGSPSNCGDGIIESGEDCDEGGSNGVCPSTCSLSCKTNSCPSEPPVVGGTYACNDGVDNDNDELVDMNDSGCINSEDNDEYNPPAGTNLNVVDLNSLLFKAGKRNIDLVLDNKIVTSLNNSYFSILIPKTVFEPTPNSLVLRAGGSNYIFSLDADNKNYFVDLNFPAVGKDQAYVIIQFPGTTTASSTNASIDFILDSLAYGEIGSDDIAAVSGASVTLYNQDGTKFDAATYGESNPITTNNYGQYGWVVPNGVYYLVVKKDDYYERKTQNFKVFNNVVNSDLSLVKIPPKLLDVIDPKASLGTNAVNVAINLGQKAGVATQIAVQAVQETVNNPVVQKTSETIVAPAATGIVVATTLPSIWFNILNFLRFIFLQPFLLIGRRKREKWGQVYNSLNKMPIDLATVRLIDLATGRVVQSRVTDKDGRFIFSADRGTYCIQVSKHEFNFPSALLKDFQNDGRRPDIYHGEKIEVKENGVFITPNIPLDPVESTGKPLTRLKKEKVARRFQVVISWTGLILTLVSLYVAPVWYVWVLAVVHVSVFFIFRRLALPKKPKGWGMVFDKSDKAPVGKVVARLFDAQFNRLISTQVTDAKGRYAFLAGDNKYYVTFEHRNYQTKNTGEIDLTQKSDSLVAVDIGLDKIKK